jgi:hypothetical protein
VRPLCIELFSGTFGWSAGWLSLGGRAIGFDLEHLPHHGPVPDGAELVLQDVLTLDGRQFRDADLILASPPCQRYSYMAMPFSRGKREASWQRWQRDSPFSPGFDLNDLFRACFRIQREASAAAGRHIPLVVENVKGAQPWVGRAKARYGSYYLWGDVESIGGRIVRSGPLEFGMGGVKAARRVQKSNLSAQKNSGGSWFAIAHNTESGHSRNPVTGEGVKVPGMNRSDRTRPAQGFNMEAIKREGVKQHGSGAAWFDEALDERRKEAGHERESGRTISEGFNNWPKDETGAYVLPDGSRGGNRSDSRKAASALIARIPYALSLFIARCFWPTDCSALPQESARYMSRSRMPSPR